MRYRFVVALAIAAAAVPSAALAGPFAFGTGERGTLQVTSSISIQKKTANLAGGWNDTGLPCNQGRKLRVSGNVFYTSPSGGHRHFALRKERIRANCAEGGPNVVFNVVASAHNLACPNGAWKPGRYEFTTRTKHLATGVVGAVALGWTKVGRC
ncbi:MAG TPA: hypothetical protein VH306_08450 [Gaiellaceae bacterium]|jgi:hypothetical protein